MMFEIDPKTVTIKASDPKDQKYAEIIAVGLNSAAKKARDNSVSFTVVKSEKKRSLKNGISGIST